MLKKKIKAGEFKLSDFKILQSCSKYPRQCGTGVTEDK